MSLRPREVSLPDWLRFADHEARSPIGATEVVTHWLSADESSSQNAPDWEMEEWSVNAFLIPVAGLSPEQTGERVDDVAGTIWVHRTEFSPRWADATAFDFGESATIGGIPVWPWLIHREHPTTHDLVIEPRADFIRYHALDIRSPADPAGAMDYVHPLEGHAVLKTRVLQVEPYNPTPGGVVHLDYLRDFLSARRAVLIVAVVADRFANAEAAEAFELQPVEQEAIGDRAWLTTTVHLPETATHGFASARGSLYWNLVVGPLDRPRVSRSPWPSHWSTEPDSGASGSSPPLFYADANGNQLPVGDSTTPAYLYFRTEVLEKYLSQPGYAVYFHMRHWGVASGPANSGSVDVGINSEGLVTAFAPDIAKLPTRDQLHWAHHSCLPHGQICTELVQTRMQLRPPDSPGALQLVQDARDALTAVFETRFGLSLYESYELPNRDRQRMSVGPIHGETREAIDLAKPLYAYLVESLSTKTLRKVLDDAGVEYQKEWRQIVLLRTILVEISGVDADEAAEFVSALKGLNALRVIAAHSLDSELLEPLTQMGVRDLPVTASAVWDTVVDAVASALERVAVAMSPRQ